MIHLFLFLPLLCALVLFLLPHPWAKQGVAVVGAGVTFILGIALLYGLAPLSASYEWLPGVHYSLALDGVSALLSMVASLMTLAAIVYASQRQDLIWRGNFYALALMMLTGLLGIFMARDALMFYLFFEATLIPSLFMLGYYGLEHRRDAAMKFALYTVAGGLMLLVSVVATKVFTGSPSFEISELASRAPGLPLGTQIWLFLGMLAAFAVKLPLVPFHAWLPGFHEQNHPSGLADVMGTLYKVGGYGLYRLALPLFPDAARALQWPLMFLAAITALYGAWIAFGAKDTKRLLAYAGLSHMGLVGLGLFSLHPAGLAGAMVLLAAQGVYSGALFLIAGMLHERFGNTLVAPVSGLAKQAPLFAGMVLAMWFAAIGVPGMAGFVGEFGIFLGAYQAEPWLTALAVFTVVAAAAFALNAFTKLWFEQPTASADAANLEAKTGDWIVLMPLLVALVFFGIYSQPFVRLIEPSVRAVAHVFGGGQ